MTMVVEDGTGLANANAYASRAYLDAYHSDRGNTKWAGTNALKEAAIIRATDYVDQRFGNMFRGSKGSDAQALEWPRFDALSDNGYYYEGVPSNLEKAVAEYALRSLLANVLAPDPSALNPSQSMLTGASNGTAGSGGPITSTQKVIGPIEIKTTFGDPSRGRQFHSTGIVSGQSLPEYPTADLYLTKLIRDPASAEVHRG